VLVTPNGHNATVVGSVAHPGVYTLTPGLRLADLMAKAGGPLAQISEGEQLDLADLDLARLLRAGRPVAASVGRALEGDVRHNVLVHAGDLLVIPPARGQRVSILGEVKAAKTVPFRRGMRLTDSLAMAGGLTPVVADGGDVRVIRGGFRQPRVYRASLDDIRNGKSFDVSLEPGDVVFVTETWWGTATDVIQRLAPLIYATTAGLTVARTINP
jgi:polysaccharide export outer membrane protein